MSILKFRKTKHGDPVKLKMLDETEDQRAWIDRLPPAGFALLLFLAASIAIVAVAYATDDTTREFLSGLLRSITQSARD